ncbi:MAG TPA: methyltransferase domain-containing protein [Thermoleophilaceae bacterium]|nr:methyltransferase domain-containing protein [Thermoleophilaceae bacterium]
MSEQYDPDNLLDRLSDQDTLDLHYGHLREREREILRRRLPLDGGDVLAVGCGRDPGRHLFPKPAWRMTGVELEEEWPRALVESGELDEGLVGRAGELDALADASFDVVLYRYVLHHVVYQGPLAPVFAEAARLLRPGGALVAMEPGALHPVGAGLALANRVGLGPAAHGTPDDIPLAASQLEREARTAGLEPRIDAVTYGWRRLPAPVQRVLWSLDEAVGSRARAARAGHTLMLVARKPGRPVVGDRVGACAAAGREPAR